ncbi:helix-turn-helix domain-containing protein [Streptoalloteichus hindustanus]|uniref:PucR C-terminal helix-turn-helix domain-containing protein n=1 Tax=Streptoalloteichus hindustanus TaxID=2017 RepID=A0A1M4ZFQ8_STRHI|nr:PucR family transcriptional regulator [Streptoalloteichus hindustanus]SHF16879.1 PucR C-terminal helix-turn-helix domain-containing protein [Streptoalloteichus hindustanus]
MNSLSFGGQEPEVHVPRNGTAVAVLPPPLAAPSALMTGLEGRMRATNRLLAELPSTLASLLRPHLGRVAGEILREIRQSVPEYALPLEGTFGRVFVHGVEQALLQFLERVAHPTIPRDRRLELFRKLGRCEVAAGRSMDTLQTAYRVGARIAWRTLAEFGQRARLPLPTMCLLAEALFAYIDELSSLSVEGYAAAQARAAGALELRRKRLLETILAVPPASPAKIADLAAAARWPLPERVTAVALDRGDDDPGLSTAPVLDEVLADLEGPEPCLLLSRADQLAALEPDLVGWRAAVGPEVPLDRVGDSLRLARQALTLVRRGHLPDVPRTLCSDHLATLWLRQDEFLVRQMAGRVLAPLADLTPKQRKRLAETLVVWLGVRGGAPEVAARLAVHPQTVRSRMRQLEKLFGDSLSDPDRRFELELALRADALWATEPQPHPETPEPGEPDTP